LNPDPSFLAVAFKMLTKNKFFSKFFLFITFWMYIYISLQRSKSHKKSQNSRNHGFSNFFLLDDGRIRIRTNPDPGGPRTYGSYGSGSTTLLCKIISEIKYLRSSHNQTRCLLKGAEARTKSSVTTICSVKITVANPDFVPDYLSLHFKLLKSLPSLLHVNENTR